MLEEPAPMLTDPQNQASIVGVVICGTVALFVLYLWTQHKSERYLLFWAATWFVAFIRAVIHIPASSVPVLRRVETGLVIPTVSFCLVLACYDLLPSKPWKHRRVVAVTAACVLAYAVVAHMTRVPLAMGYALAATAQLFAAGCMYFCYRATKLTGHALASAALLCHCAYLGLATAVLKDKVATSVIAPLLNVPLALSLLVIVYQRVQRRLAESEGTLHKIFDTAPVPLFIVQPPGGQIERGNQLAFELLGTTPEATLGRTSLELGVVTDAAGRERMYASLLAGKPVRGHELAIGGAGREPRVVAVNADRVDLQSGQRYIFSCYDLTERRRAEAERRAASEELRQLYLRLANAEDDQRRALHTELHDQVGANLSALRLGLDMASKLLEQNESAALALRQLRGAREVVIETVAMTHDLMAELRPPGLDDFGLVAALHILAETQTSRLELPIEIRAENLPARSDAMVEGALFRIAQEATLNAARHASATQVTITLGGRNGTLLMTIGDDGVGFDPAAPSTGTSQWGLRNMRERARAIGATLTIDTAPQRGTTVTVEAPWNGVAFAT
jgi:PAS domain S-box-containing protein